MSLRDRMVLPQDGITWIKAPAVAAARQAAAPASVNRGVKVPPLPPDDLEDDWDAEDAPDGEEQAAAGGKLRRRLLVVGGILGALAQRGSHDSIDMVQRASVRGALEAARDQYGGKTPPSADRVDAYAKDSIGNLKRIADRLDAGEISAAQADAWARYEAVSAYAAYGAERHALASARGLTEAAWVLGSGVKVHCEDCLRLAADSPYPRDDLPTTPGAGDTACEDACDCDVVYSGGEDEEAE